MVDMGDDAEITDIRDGHGQSVNIDEPGKGVNLSMSLSSHPRGVANMALPPRETGTNFFRSI
jgi:hypothetical protein